MQGEGATVATAVSRRRSRAITALVAAGVGLLVSLVAVASDVSPTGSSTADTFVIFVVASFLCWSAASAPWWLLIAGGVAAAVFAGASGWAVFGLAAVATGVSLRVLLPERRWASMASTVAMGGVLLALLHGTINPFFGASALITAVLLVLVLVFSLRLRTKRVRILAVWSIVVVGVFTLLAVVGLVLGALHTRTQLESGYQHLDDGLRALRAGQTTTAATELRLAAVDLGKAQDRLDTVLTEGARLVPVAAQHRRALTAIISGAIASANAAAEALDGADLDALRVAGGTIDVDALAALAEPFHALDAAVREMGVAISSVRSPWLVGVAQDRLSDATGKIDAAAQLSASTAAAATIGPDLLGADGPREYLVVFTSPGEARAQSGRVQYWAEISVTAGHFVETTSGTIDQIGGTAPPTAADAAFWTEVTQNPDVPTVAAAMADRYARSAHAVDGVLVVDPTGIAGLLRATGPITVAGVAQPITADLLEQFLATDQYALGTDGKQALAAVAGLTLQQFLTGQLPSATELGRDLGPAATEGHIVGWASRPTEQALFEQIGMSGRLPAVEGRDGLAVVSNNAAGNEIDGFLDRTIAYSATYEPSSGQVTAELTVTLSNSAPSSGLPDSVIGNTLGLPVGTNRTTLTIYSPLEVTGATIGPDVATPKEGADRDWRTWTVQVDVPPGEQRSVHMTLTGAISGSGYHLLYRPQPVVRPDVVTIVVDSADGTPEVDRSAVEIDRVSIVDRRGIHVLR